MMTCFVWTVHPLFGLFWSKHIIQENFYLIIALDQGELKLRPLVGRRSSLISSNCFFIKSLLGSSFGRWGFSWRACADDADTWRIWLYRLTAWHIEIASPQIFFLSEASFSTALSKSMDYIYSWFSGCLTILLHQWHVFNLTHICGRFCLCSAPRRRSWFDSFYILVLNFLDTNLTLLKLINIEVTAFVWEILALYSTLNDFPVFIVHAKIRYIRIKVGPFMSIWFLLCDNLLLLGLANDYRFKFLCLLWR